MAKKVEGMDNVLKQLKGVRRAMVNALPLVSAARNLRRAIQKKLRTEGKGVFYRTPTGSRRKTGLSKRWNYYPRPGYNASWPGDPPASPTGNLKRAVHIRYNTTDKTKATAVRVGVHGHRGIGALAQMLEYGLSRRVHSRPFVKSTYREELPRLKRLIEKGYVRALKKAEQALGMKEAA